MKSLRKKIDTFIEDEKNNHFRTMISHNKVACYEDFYYEMREYKKLYFKMWDIYKTDKNCVIEFWKFP